VESDSARQTLSIGALRIIFLSIRSVLMCNLQVA